MYIWHVTTTVLVMFEIVTHVVCSSCSHTLLEVWCLPDRLYITLCLRFVAILTAIGILHHNSACTCTLLEIYVAIPSIQQYLQT